MSTVSPNATGLPDRRHFLSTIASAGALTLPALPTLAATPRPDAELHHLDALLTSALDLSADLAQRCDDAYEDFKAPPIPEPLFWRKSDFMGVWIDRARLDGVGTTEDGIERFTYASVGVLDSLKVRRAEWQAVEPIDRMVGEATVARVEEIIAHLEVYEAEEARRFAECGFTAAQEADDAQCEVVGELQRRLARTPAYTAAGLAINVAAAATHRGGATHLQRRLDELLASSDPRRCDTAEMLLVSAMIDVDRLGDAVTSIDRRAA